MWTACLVYQWRGTVPQGPVLRLSALGLDLPSWCFSLGSELQIPSPVFAPQNFGRPESVKQEEKRSEEFCRSFFHLLSASTPAFSCSKGAGGAPSQSVIGQGDIPAAQRKEKATDSGELCLPDPPGIRIQNPHLVPSSLLPSGCLIPVLGR